MASGVGETAIALMGLGALLLLPGLVIVRASWAYVPFLSLSFWIVSFGFLAPAGPGRERFLHVVLAFSALLAALRLFKPLGAAMPALPTAAIVALALLRLVPFGLWLAAPGREAAPATSTTTLLVWRDGIPLSMLPLLPNPRFGPPDFGLCALAADLSLLVGTPPHRAVLLASLAGEGLLVLALFTFARRVFPPGRGLAVTAVAASLCLVAAGLSPAALAVPLAMAFAIAGGSLVLYGAGRSTSVAAGLLWAAALAVPGIPGAILPAALGATGVAATKRGVRSRLSLAASLAAALAAPTLWRTAAPLGLEGLLVPRLVWVAVPLVALLVFAAGRVAAPDRPGVAFTAAVLFLAVALGEWRIRSARVEVTGDELAAASWLREHTGPMEAVCAADEVASAWLPGLAGRPVVSFPTRAAVQPFGAGVGRCRFGVLRAPVGQGKAQGGEVFRSGALSLVRIERDQSGFPR